MLRKIAPVIVFLFIMAVVTADFIPYDHEAGLGYYNKTGFDWFDGRYVNATNLGVNNSLIDDWSDVNVSVYARSSTLTVCASDSNDKTNCDYLANGTEDQVVINNAIDALPATGGLIKLMDGTFNITGDITIATDNTSLVGSGFGTLITTTTVSINIIDAGTNDNVIISNLRIDGKNAASTVPIDIRGTHCIITNNYIYRAGSRGILLYGDYCIISNNFFNIAVNSIYGQGATYNTISDNIMHSSFDGLYLWQGSDYNTVSGNTMIGNSDGIVIDNSDHNTVVGNTLNNMDLRGILIMGGASGNVITGNKVHSSGNENIKIYESSPNNVISGNSITSSNWYGIFIEDSNDNTVIGNLIQDNDASNTATYDGIFIDNSNNTIVTGNRLQNNDRCEINITDSLSKDTLISGNIMIGTDHEATICDDGANTIINNNIENIGGSILMKGDYNFTDDIYLLGVLTDVINNITVAQIVNYVTNETWVERSGDNMTGNLEMGTDANITDTNSGTYTYFKPGGAFIVHLGAE